MNANASRTSARAALVASRREEMQKKLAHGHVLTLPEAKSMDFRTVASALRTLTK